MKKYLAAFLAMAMAATTLVGCGGSDAPASDATVSDAYKVAYIVRDQADAYSAWLAEEMVIAAEQYADIELQVFDGEADDAKENTVIENAIANGFDAIIVQPNNAEAQRPYIEKVVEAGIVAITTSSKVEGIKGVSSVDVDPYKQGQIAAELALKQIPKNARVVVLNGPSNNFHSDERRLAWQEVFFNARPDVKIVAEDFANWNKDEAMALMEDWAADYGDIDAVISMNDNMAVGALEVIKDNEAYANMLAYGVDGTAEACQLIEEGKMTATCLQSAIDLAALNLETVYKLLTGEATQIDTGIEEVLITAENAADFVEMYRERGQIAE